MNFQCYCDFQVHTQVWSRIQNDVGSATGIIRKRQRNHSIHRW